MEIFSFTLKKYYWNVMLIVFYRKKKNPFLVSFPENVYVIICSTGPRHSDYTNISGNGPNIFPIFVAKPNCNDTESESLTKTSSCEREAVIASEEDDAKEEVLCDIAALLWMLTEERTRGKAGTKSS